MSEVSESNRTLVRASFERWQAGTGSPFELLADDADWTIVGLSPLPKTYPGKQAFLTEVIQAFNARVSATPFFDTREFDGFLNRVPPAA